MSWKHPTDSGRGHELRTKWTVWRWFSWRHGWTGRRFPHTWVCVRWSLFSTYVVLVGLNTFEDEDGSRIVELGLWPLRLEFTFMPWTRAVDGERDE